MLISFLLPTRWVVLFIRVSKRIFCKEGKRRRNWDVPIPVALLLIPPRRILGNFQVVVLFTLIQIVALLPFIFSCETKKKKKKKIKHHRLDERREKGKKMRECFRPSVRPSSSLHSSTYLLLITGPGSGLLQYPVSCLMTLPHHYFVTVLHSAMRTVFLLVVTTLFTLRVDILRLRYPIQVSTQIFF